MEALLDPATDHHCNLLNHQLRSLLRDLENSEAIRQAFTTHQSNQQSSTGLPPPATSTTQTATITSAFLNTIRKLIIPRWKGSRQPQLPSSDPPTPSSPSNSPENRYVHWCVQSRQFEIALSHIRTIRNTTKDHSFLQELRKIYRKSRGWRYYFTSLDCTKSTLGGFTRIYPTQEVVTPTAWDVPVKHADYDFEYDQEVYDVLGTDGIRNIMEAELIHRYTYGCEDDNSTDMLRQIPKRIRKLEPGIRLGYGLHADQGYSFIRIFMLMVVTMTMLCSLGTICTTRHLGTCRRRQYHISWRPR